MENEIYKDIEGYEGLYQVSNLGNVKSLERIVSKGSGYRTIKERVLKPGIDGNGYYIVNLHKNGKKKPHKTHKLVAIAFLNHEPDGTQNIVVDHINNNKTDNRLDNLQLISNRENTSKDKKNGTSKYVGVCWSKQNNKWMSRIRINGKQIYLGSFDDEYDANLAYQKALKELK